ncbi:MAG: hypothetical protein FIA95_12405, partial [Gemmatimonadetes bacterium]|nr:hypothetical protein [Gemmatimonadota bacterium]
FPTYHLRSAVREIGKVLDLPTGELEKLARLAEHRSASGLAEEISSLPGFRERADAPLWKMLGELAEDVAGRPRHISQHVGGMIISSRPLVEIVPLEPAAWEGRVLCQWDKDSCEDAGFIKIDFLALGMLSLVEEAVDLIAVRAGDAPDLSRIDFQDEVVYDRICSGDTVGLFQVESRAQIQMIRRTRPRNLEELAIQVALVRPGPIVGGAVNPYVRRREMLRENPGFKVPYPHPLLEKPLAETLGVIIYQDQVLTVSQALAGFTDGQAESLRRAMSRKRSKEAMQSHWEAFRTGAAAKGVDETTAREVFQQVTAFSEFGFPKSHAAAFGLLAYQSAWLRQYHPLEYYVARFNNDINSLTWQNPFSIPAFPTAVAGQLAAAPDNQFQQLSAQVGYQLSTRTRASADVAWGRMTQDASFLAPTLNGTLAVPALPGTSLDARAKTLNANVRVNSRVTDELRVNASYTRDERDNQTRQATYPWVTTDMFLGVPRTNTPYSFTQDQVRLNADYRVSAQTRLAAGIDQDWRKYTHQ